MLVFRPQFAALPLDLVSKAAHLHSGFTPRGLVAPVGIDVTGRVARIDDVAKTLSVARAGRNSRVLLVGGDRSLVTDLALAMLFGADGVDG